MTPNRQSVYADAMQLTEADRVALVEELLDSIHGAADPAIDAAWAEEVERRIADIESGKSKLFSADEVRQSLRKKP